MGPKEGRQGKSSVETRMARHWNEVVRLRCRLLNLEDTLAKWPGLLKLLAAWPRNLKALAPDAAPFEARLWELARRMYSRRRAARSAGAGNGRTTSAACGVRSVKERRHGGRGERATGGRRGTADGGRGEREKGRRGETADGGRGEAARPGPKGPPGRRRVREAVRYLEEHPGATLREAAGAHGISVGALYNSRGYWDYRVRRKGTKV